MRRFRSTTVVLGGMGVLAATLAACGSDEPDRRCVDPHTYKELPSYQCKSGGTGQYYYGGTSRGGRLSGGSFDKSGVSRGGIGHGSDGGSSGG